MVMAADAQQVINNPSFKAAFEAIQTAIVREMETTVLDGSTERAESALELVRRLQTLSGVKRALSVYINTGKLIDLRTRREEENGGQS